MNDCSVLLKEQVFPLIVTPSFKKVVPEFVQLTSLNLFLSRKEYGSDYSCRSDSTPDSKFDVM